jgi:hypothetical protein
MQKQTITIQRYQCRHILTDGHRCGSPCLRHEEFCYYHHTSRKPAPISHADPLLAVFDFPDPEDRSAIQAGIAAVLRRIAANAIDPRRAGLLLYGLQIASSNLPRPKPDLDPEEELQMVEEVALHPTLGTIAQPAPYIELDDRYPETIAGRLVREMEEEDEAKRQAALSPMLPFVQATEDPRTFVILRRRFCRRRRRRTRFTNLNGSPVCHTRHPYNETRRKPPHGSTQTRHPKPEVRT